MRFTVENSESGRLGCLRDFERSPYTSLETPTSALLAQAGSVVHLTADVLARVFKTPHLLWLPLTSCYQLEAGTKAQGDGIAKFSGLPQHITCATFQNISDNLPTGHFELDKVPLWTKNGKKMITAERYMELMEIFKPDIILAIADGRIALDEGPKRIFKSVERTQKMLDICVEKYKESKALHSSGLVGVIVGAGDLRRLEKSIKYTLKHKENLIGISLNGIGDCSDQILTTPVKRLEDIFRTVAALVPPEMLKILEGCWYPNVIVTAIEHGWDVFDGSLPLKMTNMGYALRLNCDINKPILSVYALDMKLKRYNNTFTPLLKGCECLTCKKHSRAYIHHLLVTKEMLASVLLNIHNLHNFDQLFIKAREHIALKTFHLFKQHIIQQCLMIEPLETSTTNQPVQSQQQQKKFCAKSLNNNTEGS
ncbi:unnamed protein product [Leptosia nina]|uniref:Queuine tRNA-ribosyltransferase accessory subunit 2 n=1 Tax=Leptosia nina TaxID=320188 RepID=A0AAV1J587_9NEOP